MAERVPLGEIVDFLDHKRRPITSKDRIAGSIPYYGANGQQDSVSDYIFDEPLVLLAEDGGHFDNPARGIAYRISGKAWVNNHAHVLRPTRRVDVNYLGRVLENYDVRSFLTGSTRAKLTKAGAQRIPIPLPSLDEQRRIAAILDKADELRTKRRLALAELEVLTQSIFHSMFGDPGKNSEGWPQQKLNTLGHITTGNTPPRATPENFGDYIEWAKTDNINTSQWTLTRAKEGLSELGAKKARIVSPGSVLVTCIAGSPGVIGNVALADRTVAFNQQINAFTPNAGPSLYWYALLKSMKPLVQYASSGGMKGLVSKSALSAIDAIVVPEAMQTKFAERLLSVQRLKAYYDAQLVKIDALFASLQDRAFEGEL